MEDLRTLPKVELHLHLDCSLSFQVVSRLEPSVSIETYRREYVAPSRCTNLAEFLSCAPKGVQLMQTEEALTLVTEDLFQQLVEDGVIYAELRFAPLLHLNRGLTPERVVEIVDRTTERMIRETGIEARLILCTLRHFTEEQSMQTVQLVKKFQGSRVVALDLAGDEAGFPLDAHISAYQYAHEHGLYCTAHAGEACGPESMWETIRDLGPSRIGHGTRSIEDPELVSFLRQSNIHLELCPSSNVQIIPSIESWEHHPIHRLYAAGVPLNANTDCRMLTPTTLTNEYAELKRTFAWGPEQFCKTNLAAIDAAFVEEIAKTKLRKMVNQTYREKVLT
jgi:adenosine deaminase